MNNAGYDVTGNLSEYNIYTKVDENYSSNSLSENAIGGAIRIMTDLKKGKPVMVGVAETDKAGGYSLTTNKNPINGHFIVIRSSKVNQEGVVTFNYLDNAEFATGKGTNLNMTLDLTSGYITGEVNHRHLSPELKNYTVSEVRMSWKLNK